MKKMTAEEVLKEILSNGLECLKELSVHDEFSNGQRYVFVELLEILQKWEKAEEYGLTFNIEEKFPLI